MYNRVYVGIVLSILLFISVLDSGFGQDPCFPEPCLNQGTCQQASANTPDGQNYTCACNPGYTGLNCEIVDLCPSDPCYHGGTCVTVANGYKCMCTENYLGDDCEGIKRHCVGDNPCLNGALCEDNPSGGFTCYCRPGFYGDHCQTEIDECSSSPCINGGSCVDDVNLYMCHCLPGYEGKNCEEESFTGCSASLCQNAATCESTVDGKYSCLCVEGYTGHYCEADVDDCSGNNCEPYQVCTDLVSSYRCDCPVGRIGEVCDQIVDTCHSNPCLNQGACLHEGDRYVCQCTQPYAGINCEIQKSLCDPNPCYHGASCLVNFTAGSGFECLCAPGFVGLRCEGKVAGCLSTPCRNNGTCSENIDTAGFICDCPANYTGDLCDRKLDGCLLTGCVNGGTCEQAGNGHKCNCLSGRTGPTCGDDVNECESEICVHGQCINVPGTYICVCDDFWAGLNCQEDWVECNSSPCKNNGTCMEVVGGPPTCNCTAGTTGELCETVLDGCGTDPCQNGATCINDLGNFTCLCEPGYTGQLCDTQINECDPDPCMNNSTCVDGRNNFTCVCVAGFTGTLCEVNLNDCDPDPCFHGSQCLDEVNEYRCDCSPGYKGKNCSEDIQECASSPCLYNGICTEPVVNGFHCQCLPGIYGDNCEQVPIATFDGKSILVLSPLTSGDGISKRSIKSRGGQTDLHFVPLPWRYRREVKVAMEITFWFKTSIGNGVLLLIPSVSETGSYHHFAITLKDGILKISQDLFGDTVTADLTLIPTNQIISHHVTVVMTTTHTNVSINNCQDTQDCHVTLKPNLIGQEIHLNGPMVVGGVSHMTPYIRSKLAMVERFTGCFGNLTLNGETLSMLPLPGDSASLSELPTPGCARHESCHDDFCKIGGQCIDKWTSRRCTCTPGFSGDFCGKQITAQFTSNSFLHFGDFSKLTNLSLWISTNVSSGMILYTLDLDLLSLYIDNSQLVLHLVVNGVDFVSRVGNLASGDWFHVSAQFGQGVYRLQLYHKADGVTGSATGTVGNLLDIHTPLFIGQLHEHPALNKWRNRPNFNHFKSFSGCVQNVTVNHKMLDLKTATPSIFSNDPPRPIPGCHRDSVCRSSPCQHNGLCLRGWDNHICECQESFTGDHCEENVATSFDGRDSRIVMELDITKISFGDTGGFQFRTRDLTATLMFIQFYSEETAQVSQSLTFSLYRSQMQVSLSSNLSATLTFNANTSDAEWNTVSWTRTYDDLIVTLGPVSRSLGTVFDPYRNNSPLVRVYIGAKPFNTGNPGSFIGHLQGCIRSIHFNDLTVGLLNEGSAQSGVDIETHGVKTGCRGVDICAMDPCPGHADCQDIWNARVCTCKQGWEGSVCNISVDECVQHMCVHGKCIDGHMNYTCVCDEGYTSSLCDIIYNPCDSNPCHEGRTVNCTLMFPSAFKCECIPGWSGEICETEVNECESSPCLHGSLCKDTLNGFTCECTADYFGARCEEKHRCASGPCFNRGTCSEVGDNTDYECACEERYSGKQCQAYDFCHQHLCQNNATCTSHSEGYNCTCGLGFYGAYCQFVDFCTSQPCLNEGVCHNDKDSYRCSCTEFYSGKNCETPVNRCNQNPCFNGASCFSNITQTGPHYFCKCLIGFTGTHCETDINECQSDPCQNGGSCIESNQNRLNFFPGFACACLNGYYGQTCQNETNECESSPCLNNSTCSDLVDAYRCECLNGFHGTNCEEDRRYCSSNPCQNSGQCVGVNTGYECQCAKGFTGQFCDTNIDDCVGNMCQNGAKCVDKIDTYVCECLPGYSGELCQTVEDSCYTQPCKHNGICLYQGLCSCSDIIDLCGWYNETCQSDLCSKTPGCTPHSISYTCNCGNTGYTGYTCTEDVNECTRTEDKVCEHGGMCTNTVGNYTCDCRDTGFTGRRCETDVDECDGPSPCFNGGICENYSGSFKCRCPAGWTGQTCGELMDHCTSLPCKNGGQCLNSITGFVCNCEGTGYHGNTCDLNIDDCEGNPCLNNGRCIDGVNSYTCNCDDTGFNGERCQLEVNDCASLPCKNNGTCIDIGLSFVCNCTGTGFEGRACDADVNECMTGRHRCSGGSTCVNTEGAFTCVCQEVYTGQYCETSLQQINAPSTEDSNVGIIVVSIIVISVLLVALLIYGYYYLRKSRRMKGRYKPSQMEMNGPGLAPVIPLDKMIDPTNGERLI